ncbi:unnamed protein product [Prorocentrum cordatum]|uniref:Uncharacterized protein n=1 Tax=Prorocentrum cordatum TaxID=2364126 RepID=A0ABN9SXK1_9DINO|nr:unnamed protein product [Polarella glacialis]
MASVAVHEDRSPRRRLWRSPRRVEEGELSPERAARRLAAWAEDAARQERWLASRGGGLEAPLLGAGGGILRLRDFLPLEAAENTLRVLEALPESVWSLSEQGGDANAAEHRFWSADVADVPQLAPLRGVFWRLLPTLRGEPTLPIFSCGRYGASDHISAASEGGE